MTHGRRTSSSHFVLASLLLIFIILTLVTSQPVVADETSLPAFLVTRLEKNQHRAESSSGTVDNAFDDEADEEEESTGKKQVKKLKYDLEELSNSFLHPRKILFNNDYIIDTEKEPSLVRRVLSQLKAEQAEEMVEESDISEAIESIKKTYVDSMSTPQQIYVTVKSPVSSEMSSFLKQYFESSSDVHYHPHNSFVMVVPSVGGVVDKLKKIDVDRLKRAKNNGEQADHVQDLSDSILWVGVVDPRFKINGDVNKGKKNPKAIVNIEVQLFNTTDSEQLINTWRKRIISWVEQVNVTSHNVLVYAKKDLTIAISIPQIIKKQVLEMLSHNPIVRHIQREERFGFDGDLASFDLEELFDEDEEEEADYNENILKAILEARKPVKKQDTTTVQTDEQFAASKLLGSESEYSLDDEETFKLLSNVNALSDDYKSILVKYGKPTKPTKKFNSYLGKNFEEITNTTLNFVGEDKIGQSGLPDVKWMWSKGFSGHDQVLAIGDTGIDINNCCFYRKGQKVPYNKVDHSAHDKIVSYKSYADDKDIVRGHGSFVSSILSCSIKPEQFNDGHEMKDLFDGVQKDAKLCFFDLGLPTHRLTVPHDLSSVYFPHLHNKCGAKISSNSWGSPKRGAYTITSQEVDEWAYKNPQTVQLFAAGNGGRAGTRTITSPGTCKNCITVGSSQWTRKSFELGYPLYGDIIRHEMMDGQLCKNGGGPGQMLFQTPMFCKNIGAPSAPCTDYKKTFCEKMDTHGEKLACSTMFLKNVCCAKKYLVDMQNRPEHFSPFNMGTFSSRGPTTDNRLKPDIVAPGQLIFGSRSLGTSSSEDSEEMADSNTDKGYCPVPIANQGTSFSTPIVAGYASMIHSYFTKGYYPSGKANKADQLDPTGATLKAMLINSGQELNGMVETNGHGIWKQLQGVPSFTQGFGLVRLRHVLPFAGETDFKLFVSQDDSVSTGDNKQYCFRTMEMNGSKDQAFKELKQTLKATLVWTDYPGSPNSRIQLVNNLDLVIKNENTGKEYYGNGGRDYVNNVEQVNIRGLESKGTVFRVVVEGTNVPHGPQQFSLVVAGPLERIECDGQPKLANTRIVKQVPHQKEEKKPEDAASILQKLFSGSILADNESEN